MIVDVGVIKKEGIDVDYVLRFDNGLKLRTYVNLPFAGEKVRKETIQQLKGIIDSLNDDGWVVRYDAELVHFM